MRRAASLYNAALKGVRVSSAPIKRLVHKGRVFRAIQELVRFWTEELESHDNRSQRSRAPRTQGRAGCPGACIEAVRKIFRDIQACGRAAYGGHQQASTTRGHFRME